MNCYVILTDYTRNLLIREFMTLALLLLAGSLASRQDDPRPAITNEFLSKFIGAGYFKTAELND